MFGSKDPEVLTKEFIETIQKNSPFRTLNTDFSIEEMYAIPENSTEEEMLFKNLLKDRMKESIKNWHSKYENPMFFDIVYSNSKLIDLVIEKNFPQKFNTPKFASLGTGKISGQIVLVPKTDVQLISLDDGVFIFFMMIAEVVCDLFVHGEADGNVTFDFEKSIGEEQRKKVLTSIDEIITAYVYSMHPITYLPKFNEAYGDKKSKLSATILTAMDIFILGHEYGHMVANHLKNEILVDATVSDNQVKFFSTPAGQELEADSLGFYFVFETSSIIYSDSRIAAMSIYLLFCIWELTFKCVNMARTGKWAVDLPDTYPSFEARIGNVMFHSSIRHTKEDNFWVEYLIRFLNSKLLIELEEYLQLKFTERFAKKMQRASRWE